jgi:CO dehydrogenase/acetyl-CoA synthase delta subunit
LLDLQLLLQEIQLAITILVAGVDLFVVFRLIWFGMLREIPKTSGMSPKEAFRQVGRSLGAWAKDRKDLEEGK